MAGLTGPGREGLEAAAVSTLARLLSVNWELARSAFVTASLAKRPNIAARLQGLAPPGSLVMSEATLRLVEGSSRLSRLARKCSRASAHRLRSIGCCAPALRPTVSRPEVDNS